jgi:hypothetical protein
MRAEFLIDWPTWRKLRCVLASLERVSAKIVSVQNELAVDDFLKPDDPRMVAEGLELVT